MMNINDFARIERELELAEKGSNQFEAVLKRYTGPGTGVVWNDETKKLSVASDFKVDADGNIVKKF